MIDLNDVKRRELRGILGLSAATLGMGMGSLLITSDTCCASSPSGKHQSYIRSFVS